eukprot:6553047-Prymnesium_polylepis.1
MRLRAIPIAMFFSRPAVARKYYLLSMSQARKLLGRDATPERRTTRVQSEDRAQRQTLHCVPTSRPGWTGRAVGVAAGVPRS